MKIRGQLVLGYLVCQRVDAAGFRISQSLSQPHRGGAVCRCSVVQCAATQGWCSVRQCAVRCSCSVLGLLHVLYELLWRAVAYACMGVHRNYM